MRLVLEDQGAILTTGASDDAQSSFDLRCDEPNASFVYRARLTVENN